MRVLGMIACCMVLWLGESASANTRPKPAKAVRSSALTKPNKAKAQTASRRTTRTGTKGKPRSGSTTRARVTVPRETVPSHESIYLVDPLTAKPVVHAGNVNALPATSSQGQGGAAPGVAPLSPPGADGLVEKNSPVTTTPAPVPAPTPVPTDPKDSNASKDPHAPKDQKEIKETSSPAVDPADLYAISPIPPGDIANIGEIQLVSRYNYAGLALGPRFIGNDIFAVIDPSMAWYFDTWTLSLHVPLNLLAFESQSLSFGGMKLRREDWDEASDYLRVIRFVTYGNKDKGFYGNINSMHPSTLGRGSLIDRYQPNIDMNRSLTGAFLQYTDPRFGAQVFINDLTFVSNRVMGAEAWIRPWSLTSETNSYLRSLRFGMDYAGDSLAPQCVLTSGVSGAGCVPASGSQAGLDPISGDSLDHTFVRSDTSHGRYAVTRTQVHAIGTYADVTVFDKADMGTVNAYASYHRFVNRGGGDGLAAGVDSKLTFGGRWRHALQTRGELQTFNDGYLPSYFDSFYEVNKYETGGPASPYQVSPTKYQWVFGDPSNGYARQNLGWRAGGRVDVAWSLYHGSDAQTSKKLTLAAGLQDSNGPHDTSLYLHMEFPWTGWFQMFATYMRVKADGYQDLISFRAADNVMILGARLQICPFMFLNINYANTFQTLRSPGAEFHLGNAHVVDATGAPAKTPQDRLFEKNNVWFVTLEFGWEAADKDKD